VYYKCAKFHKNPISGLGGVVLTRYMDRWTDRQGEPADVHEGIWLLSKV
jgi:hypothetical protein